MSETKKVFLKLPNPLGREPVTIIGFANSWSDAIIALGNYAEEKYCIADKIGAWNNFAQRRLFCVNHMLVEQGQDPENWKLNERNSYLDIDDNFFFDLT